MVGLLGLLISDIPWNSFFSCVQRSLLAKVVIRQARYADVSDEHDISWHASSRPLQNKKGRKKDWNTVQYIKNLWTILRFKCLIGILRAEQSGIYACWVLHYILICTRDLFGMNGWGKWDRHLAFHSTSAFSSPHTSYYTTSPGDERTLQNAPPSLILRTIDYGCEYSQKCQKLRGDIGVISYVLTFSYRKPRSSTPKNKPFSQEMHLKIPLLSRGLKLSNSKTSCRVSALHCFVK